jgi:hypothetical protein
MFEENEKEVNYLLDYRLQQMFLMIVEGPNPFRVCLVSLSPTHSQSMGSNGVRQLGGSLVSPEVLIGTFLLNKSQIGAI